MSNDNKIDAAVPSARVPANAHVSGPKRYEKPRLTEYGPLSKITQGASGSTGESGNFTMRMCL